MTRHFLSHLFVFTQFEVLFKPQCISFGPNDLVHHTCLILLVTYGAVSGTRGNVDQVDDETSLWTALNDSLCCTSEKSCSPCATSSRNVPPRSCTREYWLLESLQCFGARSATSNRRGRVSVGSFSEASFGVTRMLILNSSSLLGVIGVSCSHLQLVQELA